MIALRQASAEFESATFSLSADALPCSSFSIRHDWVRRRPRLRAWKEANFLGLGLLPRPHARTRAYPAPAFANLHFKELPLSQADKELPRYGSDVIPAAFGPKFIFSLNPKRQWILCPELSLRCSSARDANHPAQPFCGLCARCGHERRQPHCASFDANPSF